jgi:hypothetical protein
MTAKETLNRVIDQTVVNVPPNHRNDLQRKLPDCQPYKICLQAMETYAAQQVQEIKESNEKLGNTGAVLGEGFYRLTKERDRAADLLLSAYRLICRANEFMFTDGTSISDATSSDLYHFVGNEGPEVEELLLKLGLITEDQMTKKQNLQP